MLRIFNTLLNVTLQMLSLLETKHIQTSGGCFIKSEFKSQSTSASLTTIGK